MTSFLRTAAAGLVLLAVMGAAQAQDSDEYGASPAGQVYAIERDGVSCTLSFNASNGMPPIGTVYSGGAEMACDDVRLSFEWTQHYGGHEFSLSLNASEQAALHLLNDGCDGAWPEFEIGEVRDSVCWFDAEGLSTPPRIERTQ
jgi:hypothetical protein